MMLRRVLIGLLACLAICGPVPALAASVSLSSVPVQDFFIGGVPALGGKLFVYAAGTTTKLTTYTDSTGTTPQTNPIILNARGEPQNSFGSSIGIWVPAGTPYKMVFTSSTDSDPPTSPIWTVDNISATTLPPIGTSGAVLCLLNSTCVFSGPVIDDISGTLTGAPPAYLFGAGVVASGTTALAAGMQSIGYGHPGYFDADRANGTPLVPTAVTSGNTVGRFQFSAWGSDGALHPVAQIFSQAAAGTISNTDSSANLCLTNVQSGTTVFPTAVPFCLNQAGFIQINYNPAGNPSPKNGTILEMNGADGTFTTLDMFAHEDSMGAYPGLHLELFGCTGASGCAVGNNLVVGAVGFDAYNGSGDTTNSALEARTTQAQTPTHNGQDIELWYTPNNSTAFTQGMALSPGGLGGVVIGAPLGGTAGDLGAGTLNVASSIGVEGGLVVSPNFHLRGMFGQSAPASSGTSTVTAGSTDNAGEVTGGSSVTSTTITFHTSWSNTPHCTATPEASGVGNFWISAISATAFTINTSNSGAFGWMWTCL